MTALSENIKTFRKSKRMTQKELARVLGVVPTSVSAWELGRNKPLMDNIELMSEVFGVPKSAIIGDDIIELSTPTPSTTRTLTDIMDVVQELDEVPYQENVLAYAKRQQADQDSKAISEPCFAYNYYDQPASAGTGQYLNDINAETIELPLDVDVDFVIPIKGDSMEPDYQDGDYIFVKLSVELADGTVGVFEYDKEAYIKQLLIGDTTAWLHSFNAKYPDIEINTDNGFRIIGEVVGRYREE